MQTLRGKKIFIAGATGSIGRHLAELLVASGAIVYAGGRYSEKLEKLGSGIGLSSSNLLSMDLTDPESVNAAAQVIFDREGYLDILINAAGIGIIRPLEELTLEDFEKTLRVNLVGSFLLMKAFIPSMKQLKKGMVINIPGVLGKVPMAGAAAYAASKYGLNGMMQSLREELKRTEVRITNVFLGGVDSDFWDEIDLRVQRDKMIRVEEAARAIWFLCQQPASAVVSEMVIQPFNHQAI